MNRMLFYSLLQRFVWCCVIAALASTSCVKLPRRASIAGENASPSNIVNESGTPRVSLNRATRAELETLPGIGPALAARIIEHRERYGPFRRAEHLIMVRGFSDRRFRQMRAALTVE